MTKTKKADTPETASAAAAAPAFKFDEGLAIPPKTRGGNPSEMSLLLAAMPVGGSKLFEIKVPDTVTDPGERQKVFSDLARTKSNNVTGAIRRFKSKETNAGEFETRTVGDETLGYGIRVWRTA